MKHTLTPQQYDEISGGIINSCVIATNGLIEEGSKMTLFRGDTEENMEVTVIRNIPVYSLNHMHYLRLTFDIHRPPAGKPPINTELDNLLKKYESKISSSYHGSETDRIQHILSTLDDIAATSVESTKEFMNDVKAQFNALIIILNGISGEQYNHTQKRLFANHCITTIREMCDRIDSIKFDYSTRMYDRFDYFRSYTPEKTLLQNYRNMKEELKRLKGADYKPGEYADATDGLPF